MTPKLFGQRRLISSIAIVSMLCFWIGLPREDLFQGGIPSGLLCPNQAFGDEPSEKKDSSPQKHPLRIATFNVSLYGRESGQIFDRLATGKDDQAKKIAAIIQANSPDILLINEIDFDQKSQVIRTFNEKYLDRYPYVYAAASNTGTPSGLDLDNNGKTGDPADAWGFGFYPGQYAMAVVSRFPIDTSSIRTFQNFLWKDLPGAKRPVDPKTNKPYYDDETWNQLRLSSKNHIDIPVQVGEKTIHLLACHPTPPVFDGEEDRNGCRNHDEIKFWELYLTPSQSKAWIDDQGRRGGLDADAAFVIAGDLNSDPDRGDSQREAIESLIEHQRVKDSNPTRMGNGNAEQNQTASFGRGQEMRIDYVLPSSNLQLRDSGVFWPSAKDPGHQWISATDHRLVWIEVLVP